MIKSIINHNCMKILLIFSVLTLFYSSCSTFLLSENGNKNKSNENVKLYIENRDSIITNTDTPIEIKAILKNYNDEDVAVLIPKRTSGDLTPENCWYYNIIHESGMIFDFLFVEDANRINLPFTSEYRMLNEYDSLEYSIPIYFPGLCGPYSITNGTFKENSMYGYYYIQVFYLDLKQNHKKAIKKFLMSNVLKVKFIKGDQAEP